MTAHPPLTPPASGRGIERSDAASPLLLAEGASDTPLPLAGGAGGGQFKPRNTPRARELRNQATPAERLLWTALSNRKLDGHKFSRQMPVGPYYADFLCRDAHLIVELDGYSHDMRQTYDQRRDHYMTEYGLSVLRFTNDDVMDNLDGVVRAISVALAERCPPPPPPAGGRGVRKAKSPSRKREGLGVGASDIEAQKLLGISLEGSVG